MCGQKIFVTSFGDTVTIHHIFDQYNDVLKGLVVKYGKWEESFSYPTSPLSLDSLDCNTIEELVEDCEVFFLPYIDTVVSVSKNIIFLYGYYHSGPVCFNHIILLDKDREAVVSWGVFLCWREFPPLSFFYFHDFQKILFIANPLMMVRDSIFYIDRDLLTFSEAKLPITKYEFLDSHTYRNPIIDNERSILIFEIDLTR